MLIARDILGVRVHSGPVREVIAHIDDRVARRDSTRVAFLNAHLSNVCSIKAELRRDLDGFLVLNDGIGVDIASLALHGQRFPQNLNGTDFVTTFLDLTTHDLRIFLLGARDEVVVQTAERVAQQWLRHQVVGFHHGYLCEQDKPALRAAIEAAKPDLILVGMGNPLQERWIAENVPEICTCGMAVGAWFDFVAGVVPRAPTWVQAARSEWLFRLWLEPRRLARRYLIGNFVFLARLSLARLRVVAE